MRRRGNGRRCIALLGATALLYIWGLGASGWANTYYSAAVQAGSKSWKAFFFGSLDAGNSITVDKSPGFLWVMELSARIFGVNSWSILVPQALEGVAAVGVLYATVRRWFSPAAALLAGLGARGHTGRRADVPVQQPRRDARVVAHLRGVRARPRRSSTAAPGGSCSRSRSSGSASSPRCCRR